jgi:hypothetical protein
MLTDISKSLLLVLDDDDNAYKPLAIDLCARGFELWQGQAEAPALLRALFALATSPRKDGPAGALAQNVGPAARAAVVQIASTSTPLFVSTLALEILNPKDVQRRRAIMQLVAFLVRKVCLGQTKRRGAN